MATRTYNPKKILASFNGVPIGGYADGTFMKIEFADDSFKEKVGASGEVARAQSANNMATATFTLLSTSPTNDLLMQIAAQDKLLGTGQGAFMVKDANGTSLASGNAWIKKVPDWEAAVEISNTVWVLTIEALDMFRGGNLT